MQGRPLGALRRAVGRPALGGAAALGFLVTAAWSGPGGAVGLGPVTEQSALGQSLRVVVPVLLSAGEDAGAECFRIAAAEREMDGVPQLAFGRVSLESNASGTRLVITNAKAVNDPVLRLTVQAGCETAVRREYVLLMDPPPIETPLVAADSARSDVADASPPLTSPAPPPQAASAAFGRGSRAAARDGGGAATRGTGESARSARKAAAPKPRAPAKVPPKRSARAGSDQPRLKVSSAAPAIASGAAAQAATEAEQARAQHELADSIEAETVVLRQRIVELTAMVERMQQEVRANELAQRAAEEEAKAAAEAAKAAPMAKAAAWWEANWPLLSAIVLLPLLLAAGLLWRRRQQAEHAADWQAAGAASIGVESVPAPPVSPAAPGPTPHPVPPGPVADLAPPVADAGAPPPKRVVRRAPIVRDGANALAVSELLHATEEARVYVALGHPERAIDVLNEHIRQVPRSMPAAWLMLLDLYHASGRRQDFRRLAEEFHVHCNVRAPLWEGFRSGESEEGGLETFPHILRQVAGTWRQPGCREYLEGLLYDNREGRRMGFPLAAYGDILLLLQILDAPPVIDIDSDLASVGRLDRPAQRPAAAAGNSPSGTEPPSPAQPREARPMPPEGAPTVRPSQQPLELELDLHDAARNRAKKPAS
jgi:hypothetical protein